MLWHLGRIECVTVKQFQLSLNFYWLCIFVSLPIKHHRNKEYKSKANFYEENFSSVIAFFLSWVVHTAKFQNKSSIIARLAPRFVLCRGCEKSFVVFPVDATDPITSNLTNEFRIHATHRVVKHVMEATSHSPLFLLLSAHKSAHSHLTIVK